MKYLIAIICLFGCLSTIQAQVPYADPVTAATMLLEQYEADRAKKAYERTNKEVKKLEIPAFMENASRAKMTFVLPTVFPLSPKYATICNGFYTINPKYRPRDLCLRRFNFLRKSEEMVRGWVNTPTRYRLNRGVRAQIMEEYTEIINTIEYELDLMMIESDKRSLSRILFN
ncbi:hypothetical protein [Ascidiimonas sp. W6]|uniref:hypothetical protein n=1 Tax=Ascidiimonas meishanensis TaxID=3128903 RepID=UPI0030EEC174